MIWCPPGPPAPPLELRTKVYIAGPMTGLPEFNYPAFHARADQLRARGLIVFNPADNPDPPDKRWEGYMRMAIAQLVQCDAIHLLPGWQRSRGASLEVHLACQLALAFIDEHGQSITALP